MNTKTKTSDGSFKVSNPEIYEWSSEEKRLFQNALAVLDPNSPDFYANVSRRIPWISIDEIKQHYQQLLRESKQIDEFHDHEMPTLEVDQENHEEDISEHQEASQNVSLEVGREKHQEETGRSQHEINEHEETSQNVSLEVGREKHQEETGRSELEIKEHDKEARQDELVTKGTSPEPKMKNVESKKRRRESVKWTPRERRFLLFGLDLYGKGNWNIISKNCVCTKSPAEVESYAQKFFA